MTHATRVPVGRCWTCGRTDWDGPIYYFFRLGVFDGAFCSRACWSIVYIRDKVLHG